MTVRITGMNSGLQTEDIIKELVKAKSSKVDNIKKDKTKLEWKKDAWAELNTKIKTLFNGKLANMRFSTDYKKKTTSVSNSTAVSVITGEGAMNGVGTLSIDRLAKTGYLTGEKVTATDGKSVTKDTKLSDMNMLDNGGSVIPGLSAISGEGSFTVTVDGKASQITIKSDTTVSSFVSQLKKAGIDANFDETNQRLFVASTISGAGRDFAITADNEIGFSALSVMGMNVGNDVASNAGSKTLYETLNSYTSYLAFDGEGHLDKAATVTNMQADVSSGVYGLLKEKAGKLLDTKITDISSKIATLKATDQTTYTEMDKEMYKEEMNRLQADLDALNERKKNEDYTDEYEDAAASVAGRIEFASDALAKDSSLFSESAIRIAGQDAQITLNGVQYTNNTNSVEVNGITFTCLSEATDITVTTQDDTDGIYDMIRDFFTEYNTLINEMDKLYNADSASKFKPLTDEEKETMTDKEVEKWEKKIKDSILRKDTTLGTVSQGIKEMLQAGYEVNGKTMYLSNFGIETLSYFTAADNEKNAYHIDGDDKDGAVSGNADKLKSMIANDPETVVSFFTQISKTLYGKINGLMARTDYSSGTSVYEDLKMDEDIKDYESKIKEAETKLSDYEDKYYKKFSDMEVALAKLQSSSSAVTSLLGSNQ